MKIFVLTLAMLVMLTGPALAVVPLDAAAIRAAQDYGRSKANVPLAEFLQPWTVYEERAARFDDTAERACHYSPFLLVAADARDRTTAGGPVIAADAVKLLADYEGYVVFGVTLSGVQADAGGRLAASLRQGRRTIGASLVNALPPGDAGPANLVQVYFYFPARDVAADKEALLTVTTADKRTRNFRVPFGGQR